MKLQNRIQQLFKRHKNIWKYLIIVVGLLALMLVFKNVVILSLLLILTAVVAFLVGYWRVSGYGIELSTFVTVLTGYGLGASYGIAMGIFSMLLHMVLSRNIGLYMVWVIPTYGLIGLLSGVFSGIPIAQVGIILTIAAHIFFLFCTVFFFLGNIGKYLVYVMTNIIFNVILFSKVAPLLLSLIG